MLQINYCLSKNVTENDSLKLILECEIYFIDDIPPKVTISEMVEIAKVYSTDESPVFINGILDAVFKNYIKDNKK